jgi:hypothetical protein
MRKVFTFLLIISILSSCSDGTIHPKQDYLVANGQMPNLVKDKEDNLHLIYGSGDSIMYAQSTNLGQTFSTPA